MLMTLYFGNKLIPYVDGKGEILMCSRYSPINDSQVTGKYNYYYLYCAGGFEFSLNHKYTACGGQNPSMYCTPVAKKIFRIENPSSFIVAMDGKFYCTQEPASIPSIFKTSYANPHGLSMNLLWGDMHVKVSSLNDQCFYPIVSPYMNTYWRR